MTPLKRWRLRHPGAGTGVAALERSALVLGQATPHAGVLAGLESPGQAVLHDGAAPTDRLGLFDLKQRRPGVSDGKEQLRVFVTADSAMPPVHGCISPHSALPASGLRPDRTLRL